MYQHLSNESKPLSRADDSAARLLVEVLGGTTGRNFDVESMFVERLDDGRWKWIVFEFLKAESVSTKSSHPNFYWHKNSRKFLSLWAVVQTLRQAGFFADLILVNYAEDRGQPVKEMLVSEMRTETNEEFRPASGNKKAVLNHVVTEDKIMSFEEWKKKFRNFNDTKKGDTWQVGPFNILCHHPTGA